MIGGARECRVFVIAARFVVAWWKLAGRGQLRTSLVDREIFRTVIAGRRLLVDLACGETQEELVD